MFQTLILLTLIQATPSESALADSIQRIAPQSYGASFARKYAKRILIEAKRRRLDPIALTAVGWIESNFRPSVVYRAGHMTSYGIWQLIPRDSPVLAARKTLQICDVPSTLPERWRGLWLRWAKRGGTCEDQAVADRRKRAGNFSVVELKDYVIGTYVVAFEIRKHIDFANRLRIRPKQIRGCRLPRTKQLELYQYGHYNVGPRRPRWIYISRLCKRYGKISSWIRAHNARVKKGRIPDESSNICAYGVCSVDGMRGV